MNSLMLIFSPFSKYLFIFGQTQKYSVFGYSDLTCLINNEWLFGFSQIFGTFSLRFKYKNEGKIKIISVT